jgi:hypothetical protein
MASELLETPRPTGRPDMSPFHCTDCSMVPFDPPIEAWFYTPLVMPMTDLISKMSLQREMIEYQCVANKISYDTTCAHMTVGKNATGEFACLMTLYKKGVQPEAKEAVTPKHVPPQSPILSNGCDECGQFARKVLPIKECKYIMKGMPASSNEAEVRIAVLQQCLDHGLVPSQVCVHVDIVERDDCYELIGTVCRKFSQ